MDINVKKKKNGTRNNNNRHNHLINFIYLDNCLCSTILWCNTMKKEKIPLIIVYSNDENIYIELSADTDEFKAYGILTTYTKQLEKKLFNKWCVE